MGVNSVFLQLSVQSEWTTQIHPCPSHSTPPNPTATMDVRPHSPGPPSTPWAGPGILSPTPYPCIQAAHPCSAGASVMPTPKDPPKPTPVPPTGLAHADSPHSRVVLPGPISVPIGRRGGESRGRECPLSDALTPPPFRERDPKYSEKDSRQRERERAHRRRRSYSPMRKRRRDSPSHLEARRITR